MLARPEAAPFPLSPTVTLNLGSYEKFAASLGLATLSVVHFALINSINEMEKNN